MGRLSGGRLAERLAPWGLIGFCTLWRLPGLADPPWLNDEGVYAMVGRALLHGEKLYRQVWENKPPAIYLLNAAAERLGGAGHVITSMRLLALIASVIALTALYRLMAAERGPGAARLAVVMAGIGLDLPLIDGTEANAEIFVAAASATGMALVWGAVSARRDDDRRFLSSGPALVLAGIAFGSGVLFKLPAGADALAAALVIIFHDNRLIRLAALLLGAVIPLGAITGWLAGQGLVGDALYATIGYNRGYVTTGQSLHSPIVGLFTVLAPLASLGAGAAIAWRRRRTGLPFSAGASWWLGLSLLGALASGRTYPHYFLQAVVPLAICVVLLLVEGPVGSLRLRSDGRDERPRSGVRDRHLPRPMARWMHCPEHNRPQPSNPAIRPPSEAPERQPVPSLPSDRSRRPATYRRAVLGLVAAWAILVPLTSFVALRLGGAHPAPGSDTLAYYAYFWQHQTGGLDDAAYGNRIDPRVERNIAVANYLK
ncbi:MAG: ArnT family glycosyltransferase, partial [Chloroflexota bacterium]